MTDTSDIPSNKDTTDTTDSINSGESSQNDEIIDIPETGMKAGLQFPNEKCALDSIQKWSEKVFCPLIKTRRTKTANDKVRRTLCCAHGRYRKPGENEVRPQQNVKFTKCPVVINLNEAEDGTWYTTKTVLEHQGHPVSKNNFYSHEHNKKLNEEEKEYLKELHRAKASAKNIADSISSKTGRNYSSQDVRNIIKTVTENDMDSPKAEQVLADIVNAGGFVRYHRDSVTNCIDVLYIQTADMREMLKNEKPNLFENDTTFNTQQEKYKLFGSVYFSNLSNKQG